MASHFHDFPTRVGMARGMAKSRLPTPRFPHPRGDGPHEAPLAIGCPEISPPAWGWPAAAIHTRARAEDFPTRVGMARPSFDRPRPRRRFPHPRGDGPLNPNPNIPCPTISPPAWGWPVEIAVRFHVFVDFPTRVGMARLITNPKHRPYGFPHPRGDGPPQTPHFQRFTRISPPAWGWPAAAIATRARAEDFPTRVGMARRD